MKCMSCETNIPSKWQAAISSNNCPCCGEQIMSSHVKVVADNLKSVVDDLASLGEEQMDLLLDTFGLSRKGSNLRKASTDDSEEPQIQSNSPIREWLKRSKAPHLADRNESVNDIVERVKSSSSSQVPEEWVEEIATLQEEEAQESSGVMTAKQFLSQQNQEGSFMEEDDSELHPALQKDRLKRLASSRGVATGTSGGGFNRSG